MLRPKTRTVDILNDAGNRAVDSYSLTPLDFLIAPPSKTSFTAPWWSGLVVVFGGILFKANEGARPIKSFANRKTTTPRNLLTTMCYRLLVGFAYLGIHFAGWNFYFPTSTERTLWRLASLWFISLLAVYYIESTLETFFCRQVGKCFFIKEANTLTELRELFPRRVLSFILMPFFGSYGVARVYIIVEGFISLRRLPLSAYESVEWASVIPHF